MHIGMVISTPFPPEEGIGYYVYNLSQKLMAWGHTVTVITRGSFTTETDTHDGIRVIRAPFVPLYPIHVDVHGLFVNRIVRSLEDELDLVHVHTPLTPPIRTELPIVSTIHTSVVEDAKQIDQGNAGELYYKLVARVSSRRIIAKQSARADVITTVATSVAEEVNRYYDIEDAIVVGNGVNPDEFHPPEDGPGDEYVLYVGRLAHRKGVADLLEAARTVTDRHDIEFRIVGQGPLEEQYRELTADLGIEEHTEFLGHVPREELIRLYRNATVFVLPSHYEGLPTVLLEAMSSGRAVVATAVSGCLDVIDDRENGILVPPRDPDALADGIDDLLSNPDTRTRMGAAARETILDRYTWDVLGETYETLYTEAAEQGHEQLADVPDS